jgi:hypothetical protein
VIKQFNKMKLLPQSSRISSNMLISLKRYVVYLRYIGPSAPHEDTGGIKGIPPCLPYPGIPWRWVLSFMLQPLFNRGKTPWYLLHKLPKAHPVFSAVGIWGSFEGSKAVGVKLTTFFYLVPKSTVDGSVPTLSPLPSWRLPIRNYVTLLKSSCKLLM